MFPSVYHAVGSSLRGKPLDALVREVAEGSVAQVRNRLSPYAAAMGPAELRGYVRARASRPVREVARQILEHHHLQDTLLDELVLRAVERTVHLVVREQMVQPVITIPPAHVRRRAAA